MNSVDEFWSKRNPKKEYVPTNPEERIALKNSLEAVKNNDGRLCDYVGCKNRFSTPEWREAHKSDEFTEVWIYDYFLLPQEVWEDKPLKTPVHLLSLLDEERYKFYCPSHSKIVIQKTAAYLDWLKDFVKEQNRDYARYIRESGWK